MTKYITIISGKGGVGKTTTAINLSYALYNMGQDNILVDGNVTTPNINIHLGTPKTPKTLHDALNKKIHIKEAIYKHKSGIKIIPAALGVEELKHLDFKEVPRVLSGLEGMSDIVLIDGAAGLGPEAIHFIAASDEALIICNPDFPAVTGAVKTVRIAKDLGKLITGVVLTKTGQTKYELPDSEITHILGVPIIAKIPYEEEVIKSVMLKHPAVALYPRSKVAHNYNMLAAQLLGKKYDFDLRTNPLLRLIRKIGLDINIWRRP